MRYILNDSGYIFDVSFGAEISCSLGNCKEYTGEIPAGYSSLEEWHDEEIDRLNAWKVIDGNLVYDPNKAIELEEICRQQEENNRHVTRKELDEELGGISFSEEEKNLVVSNAEQLANILPTASAIGDIVEIDNASYNPFQLIEMMSNSDLTGSIKLFVTGKNILKNTAVSNVIGGIVYTVDKDKSININGTATDESEFSIAGTASSVVPLFMLKKRTDYYLNALPEGVTLNMYSFDGTDLAQVYSGNGGEVLNFDEETPITYVTLYIKPSSEAILAENNEQLATEDNKILMTEEVEGSVGSFVNVRAYPMLSVGSEPEEYEAYKENSTTISLENITLKNTDILRIESDGKVSVVRDGTTISLGSINMPYTFSGDNTIYTLQDTEVYVEYKKSSFDYVTATGSNGHITLRNTADGYGSIRKLTLENLTADDTYILSSYNDDEYEDYEIDLTNYTGKVTVVIENNKVKVYKNNAVAGSLDDICIKTYSPTTELEVDGICDITCEYMLESDFSVYCTRAEKDASIKIVEDMIKLEVTRAKETEGELRSSITVEAGKIEQIVESVGEDGEVTASSIIQSINADGSSIKIDADKVDITGKNFPTLSNKDGTAGISATGFSSGAFDEDDAIEYVSPAHVFNSGDIVLMNGARIVFWNDDSPSNPYYPIEISERDILIGTEDEPVSFIVNGIAFDGRARFG